MCIVKLEIRNFKSLPNITININNINCLIGTNNVGKSSIMKALHFFYSNLTETTVDTSVFNELNPFNQSVEICVHYDVSILLENGALHEYESVQANRILDLLKRASTPQGILIVKMKRLKTGETLWNISSYELRALLRRRFPIFFLESRNINLYEWDMLWEIVSLINPVRQRIDDNIITNLDANTTEILTLIKKVFYDNDIKIKDSSVFQKIEIIMQLHFGGKKFDTYNQSLRIDSFGQNSFRYIKTYIDLILKLFNTKKLSTPLLMLDEPEIHLHPQMVEKLVKSLLFSGESSKIKFIISTHSATLLKNIIIEKPETQVLHLSRGDQNLKISKINDFRKNKGIKFMSDRESNLFFSEACLFVEGETELELFSNSHLSKYFPNLKMYTIYNFDSKLDKLMLVHPFNKNYKSVYRILIDMDKILNYKEANKSFQYSKKEKELNILINSRIIKKQKYYYTNKYKSTYLRRKTIERSLMLKTYTLDKDHLIINEYDEYKALIHELQNYFLEYNTFPVSTTIEGILINEHNVEKFIEWLNLNIHNTILLNQILSTCTSDRSKASLLRILFMGKNDALLKDKCIKILNKPVSQIRVELMKRPYKQTEAEFFNKNSGWVTRYLNWSFENYIQEKKGVLTYFPELANILKLL